MSAMTSQITGVSIIRSGSLAFVRGIHRWPMDSPHKGPVTRKMFPFDDVIMSNEIPFRITGLLWDVDQWEMWNYKCIFQIRFSNWYIDHFPCTRCSSAWPAWPYGMLGYSRDELLKFQGNKHISRSVRKTLFKYSIWCPESRRLILKPRVSIRSFQGAKGGLLNTRSINEKESSIYELITDNQLDFFSIDRNLVHW